MVLCMRSEKGFTLLEVIMGMAILTTVGVAIILSLALACRVLMITDNHETARDLAEAQMEYIQKQLYSPGNSSDYQLISDISTKYPGYTVVNNPPMKTLIDQDGNITNEDSGIQMIRIVVQHDTETVFTLYGRKVQW